MKNYSYHLMRCLKSYKSTRLHSVLVLTLLFVNVGNSQNILPKPLKLESKEEGLKFKKKITIASSDNAKETVNYRRSKLEKYNNIVNDLLPQYKFKVNCKMLTKHIEDGL